MYGLMKKCLFRLDPEVAHERALKGLRLLGPLSCGFLRFEDERLRVKLDGLDFPNPLGLAAGFDKDAVSAKAIYDFGYGFVEVGTLTPRPQPGNPKPRLFRIPEQRAILNRMGFNNGGAEAAASRLTGFSARPGPLGVNIGKNKDTPLAKAVEDYVAAFRTLAPHGDYVAVNVSSPNTEKLRDLQAEAALDELFAALNAENEKLKKPLWLKVAPNLSAAQLEGVVSVVEKRKIYGVIATNTTTDKSALPLHLQNEAGGVSGAPVREASDRVLKFLSERLYGRARLMGVGGVSEAAHVADKIALGADLVEVYTGWIYGGPLFVKRLLRGLLAEMDKRGCTLAELRGSALRR